MNHTRILSKTYRDNSGMFTELPLLLIEYNGKIAPLWSLHKYMLKNEERSLSWKNKLIQIVGLLLDYLDANYDCVIKPVDLFESFANAIYIGTIDENGKDSSGLYWIPKRIKTARSLLFTLSEFSDWMHEEYGSAPLNPWVKASYYEEKLNKMAQVNKSYKSFLGHLDDSFKMSEVAKKARNVKNRQLPTGDFGGVKFFPDDKIDVLLQEGFKFSAKNNKLDFQHTYNWRDIAITILMHGGGLRVSESFHIWIHDVMPDPADPHLALVRVYHPIDGAAPKDFKNPKYGRYITNRDAYLRIKYGISNRIDIIGVKHAGWKKPYMSDDQQNYIHVHWFPKKWGYLFMQVWKMYMAQRIIEKIPDTHPFLFVSFDRKNKGEMYTISAFQKSHAKAVEKIGLPVGKMHGTTPHGHRHAYGKRCSIANVGERVIKAALHHKSEESQKVYTEPTIDQITKVLSEASIALDEGQPLPMKVDIDEWIRQEVKNKSY